MREKGQGGEVCVVEIVNNEGRNQKIIGKLFDRSPQAVVTKPEGLGGPSDSDQQKDRREREECLNHGFSLERQVRSVTGQWLRI